MVLTALCAAAAEGNSEGLQELLDKTDKVTVDSKNRVSCLINKHI